MTAVGEDVDRRYARPNMAHNPGTHVRLPPELWDRIDLYRREHQSWPPPTRPQAIKELVKQRLDEIDAAKLRHAAEGKGKP